MDTLFDFFYLPVNMNSWFVLMLTLFVKGTLILTATGLLVYVLRRSSAGARYSAWCAGLLSLLALPVLSALLPQWQTGLFSANSRTGSAGWPRCNAIVVSRFVAPGCSDTRVDRCTADRTDY